MVLGNCDIWDGIAVGAVGGASASLIILSLQGIKHLFAEYNDRKLVYNWLLNNTQDEDNKRYRSTRTIASYNNMTEDRVRYICSHHDQIYLSTGETADLWGIHGISGRKIT